MLSSDLTSQRLAISGFDASETERFDNDSAQALIIRSPKSEIRTAIVGIEAVLQFLQSITKIDVVVAHREHDTLKRCKSFRHRPRKTTQIRQLADFHNLTVLVDTDNWSSSAAMALVIEGLHEGSGDTRRKG